MTTIHLLRHGETEENLRSIYQGQNPGKLSTRGKEQAEFARSKIEQLNINVAFCSDLKRAKDTAQIVLRNMNIKQIFTPLIRERSMGKLTGQSIVGEPYDEEMETKDMVSQRAKAFISLIHSTYDQKTLLVISHGYFCRILQSLIEHKDIHKIQELKNCEIRTLIC